MSAPRPPTMLTYHCKHCGAIIALLVPGALVYDTTLQCVQCSTIYKVLKRIDTERQTVYHSDQAVKAPA